MTPERVERAKGADIFIAQLDWLSVVQNVGVAAGGLMALSYFVYKAVWPFLVRIYDTLLAQLAEANKRSETIAAQFTSALERRDAEFKAVVTSMDRVASKVEELAKKNEHDPRPRVVRDDRSGGGGPPG